MENLCFTYKNPQMEAAYTVFNKQTHQENLYTLIFFAIWSLISTDIPAIIEQNYRDLGIAIGVCLLLIIITLWKKIPKELSQCLTPIIVFLFNMTGFYLTTNQYTAVPKPIMFFRGYGFASIQLLLYIHCRDFQKKVMVIMATFIIRYSIMINLDYDTIQPETICRQIAVDIFAIYTFYTQERRQRQIFQDYYKSNHQVSQLTDLIHDFMPSCLAILDTKFGKILFSNKAFAQNFNTQEPSSPVSATNHTLLAFGENSLIKLMRLKIDKITSRSPILITSRHVKAESIYLDKFLQDLQEKEEFYEKGFSCSFIGSYDISSSDSPKKTFEVTITPIGWQDSPALAFILTDITVQETLMICKVDNDKKDAVVATVSHELRTPLNGIIGMLDLVEKKIEDPEVMEYIDLCKDNSRLLLSLVNSILDMEQIKQKKLKLNPTRVSLQKLLESVLQLFQFQCNHKNLNLAMEIDENCPTYLFTDENRLKQILINLIGNALKFTFAGDITIHAHKNQEKPDYITISVSDTGIGIKEEDRANLFKKFGRLEDGEGVNQNGVGLGLVISDTLARLLSKKEKHEAGITVESQYGLGSTFSFEILIACPCEASPMLKAAKYNSNFDEITLKLSDDHSSDDIEVGIELIPGLSSNKISTNVASHVLSSPQRNMNFTSLNQCISQEELYLMGRTPRRNFTQTILSNGRRYSSPHRSSFHLKKLQEKSIQYIVDQANQMSLLVVDDNPFNLLVAQGIIEELGYGCVTAKSGEEAIDLFKTNKSEALNLKAILMDCQMPGMDGFETTKALLEIMGGKELNNIPIIALTANSHEEDIKKCYEYGMVDVIQKPMNPLSLAKSLNRVKEKEKEES